jgi:hypothetical protein
MAVGENGCNLYGIIIPDVVWEIGKIIKNMTNLFINYTRITNFNVYSAFGKPIYSVSKFNIIWK